MGKHAGSHQLSVRIGSATAVAGAIGVAVTFVEHSHVFSAAAFSSRRFLRIPSCSDVFIIPLPKPFKCSLTVTLVPAAVSSKYQLCTAVIQKIRPVQPISVLGVRVCNFDSILMPAAFQRKGLPATAGPSISVHSTAACQCGQSGMSLKSRKTFPGGASISMLSSA